MTRFENRHAHARHCADHGHHQDMRRLAMHMRAGHHHRGHKSHGRGKRPLQHGDLRYLLLQLIDEQPRHGYDLMRDIGEKTGGAYEPSPGVVYPALEVLQDLGWVTAEARDGKKVFNATPEGQSALTEASETLAAIEKRLSALTGTGHGPSGSGDIHMAMRQLAHTVRQSLSDAPEDEARHKRIAQILAEARHAVEAL